MPNLDRFSQPMSWEWLNRDNGPDFTECEEPILCACGCKEEIYLEDEGTYVADPDWSNEYFVLGHLEIELEKENDQLVGSQSR